MRPYWDLFWPVRGSLASSCPNQSSPVRGRSDQFTGSRLRSSRVIQWLPRSPCSDPPSCEAARLQTVWCREQWPRPMTSSCQLARLGTLQSLVALLLDSWTITSVRSPHRTIPGLARPAASHRDPADLADLADQPESRVAVRRPRVILCDHSVTQVTPCE